MINVKNSTHHSESANWGVADSTTSRVRESTTLRLTDGWEFSFNIQLPILRLAESKSQGLPESPSQRIGNSPTPQVGESAAPPFGESESLWLPDSASRRLLDSPSRRLPDSPSWRVRDYLTHRVGEQFFKYEYLREFEAKNGMAQKVV
jgi:hypothetical protein